MKTINSKSPPFYVSVFGKKVFINMDNGDGFYKVFEYMHPSIIKLSKFFCSINNIEYFDAYQEICVFMLEGLLKYDLNKSSLSSFLYLYSYNKIIDASRKKDISYENYNDFIIEDKIFNKVGVLEYTKKWDNRWKKIMYRVFIKEDFISAVARDENITSWGLTKAIKKKLKEAKNL